MQVQSFCWLPLRKGTIIVSAACFLMAVLNVVSAALPQDEAQPSVTIVSRSVHAVLAVVYAAAGTLLAFALFLGSIALVRLWLALFAAVTMASLLAHDLARYDWMALEQDSSAAVVAGIGLLNIVLDVVFLMAVFSLMREMERQKADDVEAALRPRPRASPDAPSVAPALPLKDLVPPRATPALANTPHPSHAAAAATATTTTTTLTHHHQRRHDNGEEEEDDSITTTRRREVGNIGRSVSDVASDDGGGGYVAPDRFIDEDRDGQGGQAAAAVRRNNNYFDVEEEEEADGDCSGTESVFESHAAYSARRGGKANEKRLSRDSGWAAM